MLKRMNLDSLRYSLRAMTESATMFESHVLVRFLLLASIYIVIALAQLACASDTQGRFSGIAANEFILTPFHMTPDLSVFEEWDASGQRFVTRWQIRKPDNSMLSKRGAILAEISAFDVSEAGVNQLLIVHEAVDDTIPIILATFDTIHSQLKLDTIFKFPTDSVLDDGKRRPGPIVNGLQTVRSNPQGKPAKIRYFADSKVLVSSLKFDRGSITHVERSEIWGQIYVSIVDSQSTLQTVDSFSHRSMFYANRDFSELFWIEIDDPVFSNQSNREFFVLNLDLLTWQRFANPSSRKSRFMALGENLPILFFEGFESSTILAALHRNGTKTQLRTWEPGIFISYAYLTPIGDSLVMEFGSSELTAVLRESIDVSDLAAPKSRKQE